MTTDPPDESLTLWEAMSRLQCQLPRIAKRSDAQYGKYADLASISREILPLLGMLGLSFTCAPGFDAEGRFALNYQLEHISGEGRIAGSYPLPTGTKSPGPTDGPERYATSLQITTDEGILSFLSTTTIFGAPIDVTLSELALKMLFPADAETIAIVRKLAANEGYRLWATAR